MNEIICYEGKRYKNTPIIGELYANDRVYLVTEGRGGDNRIWNFMGIPAGADGAYNYFQGCMLRPYARLIVTTSFVLEHLNNASAYVEQLEEIENG